LLGKLARPVGQKSEAYSMFLIYCTWMDREGGNSRVGGGGETAVTQRGMCFAKNFITATTQALLKTVKSCHRVNVRATITTVHPNKMAAGKKHFLQKNNLVLLIDLRYFATAVEVVFLLKFD
jgi:hypothetical protein